MNVTLRIASPIVMVKKKDGFNRVCVDLRKLNKITEADPEPITMAANLFRRLDGKKYLSNINLTEGYWQIQVASEDVYKQVASEDVCKTAFVTWDGQYFHGVFMDAIWDGKLSRSYSCPRTEESSRRIVRSR